MRRIRDHFGLALTLSLALVGPPAGADTLTGAYVRGNGWEPAEMAAFAQDTKRGVAIANLFTSFDYDWNTLSHQSSHAVAQGSVPMITWEPTVASRPDDNLLPEILNGEWDSYIDEWVVGLRTWMDAQPVQNRRVLIRFAHEFNGIWYPWANDPGNFVPVWRYVHQKFADAGLAGNVEWVWNANNVDVDDHHDITMYYPGDDVVDWTSIDGYNWGSNYSFTKWRSFAELFEEKYNLLMLHYPSKPILIAEVASAEPTDVPNPALGQEGDDSDARHDKGEWIADMMHQLRSRFHGVKAFAWFNINKELGWSLNESGANTGLVAYRKALRSGYFESDYMAANDFTSKGIVRGVGKRRFDRASQGFRALSKSAIAYRRALHHEMLAGR